MEKDTKYFIGIIAILIISIVYLNVNENLMSSEAIKDISGMAVGDNIALKTAGTTCSVSKVIFGSLPCTNAIDGNIGTYWVIGAQKDMAGKGDNYPSNVWIKLTLKEDKWVDKIILKSIIKKAIGWVKNGKLTLVDSNGKIVHEIKNIVVPYGRSVPNGVTVQFKENEYLLNVDESVIINSHKVTLVNVGSGGSIIVGVDGVLKTIPANAGTSGPISGGIGIVNKETFYNDIKSKRSAKILIRSGISSLKIRSAKFEMIQTWGPNAGIAEFEIYEGKAPIQQPCTDSDGGKNYNVKGITKGIAWGTTSYVAKEDFCSNEKVNNGIVEYYCTNFEGKNLVASETYACPNGCSNGACVPEASTILIEKNFGVLKFIKSSVLRDNCELMELERGIDEHTCDSYMATYDIDGLGLGSVEVVIEVRDTEPINKEKTISDIANYLINNEGMSLHIEGVGGQKVYTLEKSIGVKRDAAVLWASGNKIIAISVDDWDTTLMDDDIFEDLLDAYLVKYPSDFKF